MDTCSSASSFPSKLESFESMILFRVVRAEEVDCFPLPFSLRIFTSAVWVASLACKWETGSSFMFPFFLCLDYDLPVFCLLFLVLRSIVANVPKVRCRKSLINSAFIAFFWYASFCFDTFVHEQLWMNVLIWCVKSPDLLQRCVTFICHAGRASSLFDFRRDCRESES